MKSYDIEQAMTKPGQVVSLGDLRDRVLSIGRASWKDLPKSPGIYAVCLDGWQDLSFTDDPCPEIRVDVVPASDLRDKRDGMRGPSLTDIIYIGKSKNLRGRVKDLARFGAGKARNHKGGQSLWQIDGIHAANVWMWPCHADAPRKLEKQLLKRFDEEHHDWPLANMQG